MRKIFSAQNAAERIFAAEIAAIMLLKRSESTLPNRAAYFESKRRRLRARASIEIATVCSTPAFIMLKLCINSKIRPRARILRALACIIDAAFAKLLCSANQAGGKVNSL